MKLSALGDSALLVELATPGNEVSVETVLAAVKALQDPPIAGIVDIVPAFASLGVFFNPAQTGKYGAFCNQVRQRILAPALGKTNRPDRHLVIPVCYDDEYGPDLAIVAAHTGLARDAVIALHSSADYVVRAVGFSPGFPFLEGLPPALATPRRATPRTSVPAGSVGIGGLQTGVYPFSTPGGWQVIGRTPSILFAVDRTEPALLQIGDYVNFKRITSSEFATWKSP